MSEQPNTSAEDDIKIVLQNSLMQIVKALLAFTRTEAFALQIPETDTHIFAGPLPRIAQFVESSSVDWRPYQSALSRCAELLDNMSEGDPLVDAPRFLAEKLAQMMGGQPAGDGLAGNVTFSAASLVEFVRAAITAHMASQSQAAQPSDGLLGAIARGWCAPESESKELDSKLVFAIGREVAAHLAGQSQATKAQAEPVRYEIRLAAPHGSFGQWDACDKERFDHFNAHPDVGDGFTYEVRALYLAAPVAKEVQAVPEVAKALRELMSIVKIHSDETGENFAWAEMQYAEEVLSSNAAQEVTQQTAPECAMCNDTGIVGFPPDQYEECPDCIAARTTTQQAAKAETAEQAAVLEEIAQSWDGCKYDSVGETLDIGEVLRDQFKKLAPTTSAVSATSSTSASAPAAADEVTYNPNHLLDVVLNKMELLNDAALARMLEVSPMVIAKIRRHRGPVSASLLIRMREVTSMSIRDLRDLMGDRRAKYRLSDAAWTEAERALRTTSGKGDAA